MGRVGFGGAETAGFSGVCQGPVNSLAKFPGNKFPAPVLDPVMIRLVALALLASSTALQAAPQRFSSGASRVSLIELYTSEGCSSCPAADTWLGSLANKPGLWKEFVPVEFHVNYWDKLGWVDRLSSPQYTAREYAYSSLWGAQGVYTPCFARDGEEWKPNWGSQGSGESSGGALEVELGDDRICRVLFRPGPNLRLRSALYEVHLALLGGGITSRVTQGENRGETLRHDFVVLGLGDAALVPDVDEAVMSASLPLPTSAVAGSGRRSLAAWITRDKELSPIQATGGWLP